MGALSGTRLLPGRGRAGSGRPNIVLILADDMGYSDLGCYGSEISTPNLDRLAKRGMRFTHFYSAARCCPSRASLMTGLYPHQTGVGHMGQDFGLPGYRGFLNDRCITIAEALRETGYRTLMSGKWHLGSGRPHWPVDRGFERSFGLLGGTGNYFRPARLFEDGKAVPPPGEEFYITDAFTDKANDFIGQYGGGREPFFLYLAYTAPHFPLHALPGDIARYRGRYKDGWDVLRRKRHARMVRMGIVDGRWPLSPRDPEAPAWDQVRDQDLRDLKMAVYAAQIDRMDRGIGRVLDKLREVGAESNTLLLYLSDNGGCAETKQAGDPGAPIGTADSFASYGLPWANASNTPFRLFKHWTHEGGISTPLIACWPDVIPLGNVITREVGHIIDILPTCLDVAGARYAEALKGRAILPAEGTSLLPIFRGKRRTPHETLFWEHEGNRAVRKGDWKLVAGFREDWELYDLKADRTETRDLAGRHSRTVREMADAWAQWAKRCGVVPWTETWEKSRGIPR
ncbi:MAG: arylsulfatase [Acidobacteria bacterium]|nr:arylsulfatase [Acidobacteriota bacterium]